MIVAAGFGEDLFRGVLQGLPPGAVYGLIAIGFVLTYKTSGVFNLAFGAQAYVSAALYFQARNEWGWSNAGGVRCCRSLILAPALGLLLERLIFRRPAAGLDAGQAGDHHRPVGRHPEPVRADRRVRAGRRPHPRGARSPTGRRSSTTRSASTRSAATS